MSTKVAELANDAFIEMGQIIDFDKQKKIFESRKTVALSCNNEQKVWVTYIANFLVYSISSLNLVVYIILLCLISISSYFALLLFFGSISKEEIIHYFKR